MSRRVPELAESDRAQVAEVLQALRGVFGDELVGVYLHGSAVLGGLRSESDIDVLAVAERRTTRREKAQLVGRLLAVSGASPAGGPPRPIELTIVVSSEIRPWRYPPRMDFQYGDWWRDRFESGELEPWPSETNPDLALLVSMVLLGGAALADPPPHEVFDPVPRADFVDALVAGVPVTLQDIDWDTRNVVLTLVRSWCGMVTGEIRSKDAAADWALPRLAPQHRAVLARARHSYLGGGGERWDDLEESIRPFADAVVAEIEAARR